MKAILITYNQAYYDEIAKVLNDNGTKGFTEWNEIKGHGSDTGEPHYGTLNQLHEKDLKTPDLGLRAFSWNIEKMI